MPKPLTVKEDNTDFIFVKRVFDFHETQYMMQRCRYALWTNTVVKLAWHIGLYNHYVARQYRVNVNLKLYRWRLKMIAHFNNVTVIQTKYLPATTRFEHSHLFPKKLKLHEINIYHNAREYKLMSLECNFLS